MASKGGARDRCQDSLMMLRSGASGTSALLRERAGPSSAGNSPMSVDVSTSKKSCYSLRSSRGECQNTLPPRLASSESLESALSSDSSFCRDQRPREGRNRDLRPAAPLNQHHPINDLNLPRSQSAGSALLQVPSLAAAAQFSVGRIGAVRASSRFGPRPAVPMPTAPQQQQPKAPAPLNHAAATVAPPQPSTTHFQGLDLDALPRESDQGLVPISRLDSFASAASAASTEQQQHLLLLGTSRTSSELFTDASFVSLLGCLPGCHGDASAAAAAAEAAAVTEMEKMAVTPRADAHATPFCDPAAAARAAAEAEAVTETSAACCSPVPTLLRSSSSLAARRGCLERVSKLVVCVSAGLLGSVAAEEDEGAGSFLLPLVAAVAGAVAGPSTFSPPGSSSFREEPVHVEPLRPAASAATCEQQRPAPELRRSETLAAPVPRSSSASLAPHVYGSARAGVAAPPAPAAASNHQRPPKPAAAAGPASCPAHQPAVVGWFRRCRGCSQLTGATCHVGHHQVPFCCPCLKRVQALPAEAQLACQDRVLQIHCAWAQAGC
jgi:hypothetical protein